MPCDHKLHNIRVLFSTPYARKPEFWTGGKYLLHIQRTEASGNNYGVSPNKAKEREKKRKTICFRTSLLSNCSQCYWQTFSSFDRSSFAKATFTSKGTLKSQTKFSVKYYFKTIFIHLEGRGWLLSENLVLISHQNCSTGTRVSNSGCFSTGKVLQTCYWSLLFNAMLPHG